MTVTEFRKTFATLPAAGWLTEAEGLLLVDYASRRMSGSNLVEFGSYCGRSAKLLGTYAYGADVHLRPSGPWLHCVDPWGDFGLPARTGDQAFAEFYDAVKGLPVVFYRTRVEDWTPCPAGFVYCDGDHSYEGTLAQIRKALECKPQVIAVHDVNDAGGGREVKKACLELLGPWTERVERLAAWELNR